jgi:hypothetical protein
MVISAETFQPCKPWSLQNLKASNPTPSN